MPVLPHRTILDLHKAVVRLRLNRVSLLIGLSDSFVASLPDGPDFASQILSDLGEINRTERLLDQTVPLEIWLENALSLAGDRADYKVFQGALDAVVKAATRPARAVDRGSQATSEASIIILILSANPSDQESLRLGREVREISRRLGAIGLGERFEIRQEWAVRLTDLHEALLKHRPTIVHFSGHGDTSGALLFEDERDNQASANPAALADLFRILRDRIRVVVLNSCLSSFQASEISRHIDCVIGMRSPIEDAAAIEFSAAFYQSLGFERSVAEAFELGRNQIDLLRLPDGDAPVLLCRDGVDPKGIRLV